MSGIFKDMKNNADNLDHTPEPINEQQLIDSENDAVWNLLDNAEQASPVEASPMFARNIMREIRLDSSKDKPAANHQGIISPAFTKAALALAAAFAIAAIIITNTPKQHNDSQPTLVDQEQNLLQGFEDISIEELSAFSSTIEVESQDEFTDEMLDLANQDPFYISEEEIEIAMNL